MTETETTTRFEATLDERTQAVVDACTRCGKCVEVCPTPKIAEIAGAPEQIAGGVIDILGGAEGEASSQRWAEVCCGSGFCISACPEGINPRFMLTMARRAMARATDAADRRETGKQAFKAMSRGVKVLSRLQLPPELMARLSPASHPAPNEDKGADAKAPDIVFYTGCNLLKTPHIGLLCLDVLDKLEVRYEVHGGPANCCGILQLRAGDAANGGRQLSQTARRYADTGAAEVISWCPTCQIQFDEVADPLDFGTDMFPIYLARRLDVLKPMMTTPVAKRIALVEFPGALGVTDAVLKLLGAVKGLEVVTLEMPTDVPRAGYQMSAFTALPEFRRRMLAETFRAAERQGVDAVVSVFHADHRELAAHEGEWPFEIVNYMELLGAALGLARDDVYKRLKLMRDVDTVFAAVADQPPLHGLDAETVREVIVADNRGDQHLPVER
ncbi:MAG: (Fe-S)-binding protein, partial [Rhodospirillaceae bacterium]